jgi:uncharacterized protein (DUF58 family)
MLSGAWLSFTIALILMSLLTRQVALLVAGLTLLLAQAASWVWGRYALVDVGYDRTLSEARAFFGEQVTLAVRAENRKMLPLAWLAIEDEFPQPLRLARGRVAPSHKPRRALLNNLLTLRWYERITRRYPLVCAARGEHVFGPARLRTGDIFGFVEREVQVPALHRLVVYPRVLPVRGPGIPSRQVIGLLRARRRIIEDPLRLAGVREYAPGDSPRRVHWKVSARTGVLHTKLLEPSTSTDLLLFLNVSTVDPFWLGVIEDRLELAVITAAALARQELRSGNPVGLYVNSSVAGGDQPVRILPGRDPEQFARLLDALARVIGFQTVSFPAFLRREARNLPWGTTIAVVTGVLTDELAVTLLRLRRAGRSVALVLVGDDHARPVFPGIPVWLVRGEREWRDLEAVALV